MTQELDTVANVDANTDSLPEIHVSDIILFKRCRRQWNWRSDLRLNLVPAGERAIKPLWFGSGWHFALEDFRGHKRFPTMFDAFKAYCDAWPVNRRPSDWEELLELAEGMANYFVTYWLPKHNDFQVAYDAADGKPLVEIKFKIPIPGMEDRAVFAGTFDGIATDVYGRPWILEYKTAAQANSSKLDIDSQTSYYMWAAEQYFGKEFEGVAYYQFVKSLPHPPKVLANGELSQATNQRTTHAMYRAELLSRFGEVPQRYVAYLNSLLDYETPEGNKYIRIDPVRRNRYQLDSVVWQLRAVAEDMLNPDLPLYPNPLPECAHQCSFKNACLAVEDGSDYDELIASEFTGNPDIGRGDWWRARIRYPGDPERADEIDDELGGVTAKQWIESDDGFLSAIQKSLLEDPLT